LLIDTTYDVTGNQCFVTYLKTFIQSSEVFQMFSWYPPRYL